MEKKKTTYRYGGQTEKLIEEGFKMYKRVNVSGNLTLSGLIDHCIFNSIKALPEEIGRKNRKIFSLESELRQERLKNEYFMKVFSKIQKNKKERENLNDVVQNLLNAE